MGRHRITMIIETDADMLVHVLLPSEKGMESIIEAATWKRMKGIVSGIESDTVFFSEDPMKREKLISIHSKSVISIEAEDGLPL